MRCSIDRVVAFSGIRSENHVISGLEIKGFRGIREGKLDSLTPLVILVGPNGGGKSTILDALLIGSIADPSDGIVRVIKRHRGTKEGARWLLYRGGASGQAMISVSSTGFGRRVVLMPSRSGPANLRYNVDLVSSSGHTTSAGGESEIWDRGNGNYEPAGPLAGINRPVPEDSEIWLIEPYDSFPLTPLHTLHTRTVTQGHRDAVRRIMGPVVPGLVELQILTEGDSPILHFVFPEGSVPVAIAGDGVRVLTRLCLELAVGPRGTILLEEPETHQHPRAIRQTAKAIIAAMRSDIQIVLTTHSLELIDALLDESLAEELKDKIALYRVILRDGELKSHRHTGDEAIFARSQIEDDLR
jgi:predicted ATPase